MAAATAAPSPDTEQAGGPGLGLLVVLEGVLDARRWGWNASEETLAADSGQDAVFGLRSLSAAFGSGAADPAGGPKAAADRGSVSPTRRASTRESPSRLLTSLLKSGRSGSRSPTKSSRSPASRLKSPRLKSPRLKSQSPSRRRARSNRKSRTPVPSEVIERMAKSAPGAVTASPLERGLYIQKVPLLQGLLVADQAKEGQADRKVTSLLVADPPREKQADRKAADSSHTKQADRKLASLLPVDALHETPNDRKVADPPLAPQREKQADRKAADSPHKKRTDRRGSADADPQQAKASDEEAVRELQRRRAAMPRRPCAPIISQAAESGDELRVVRQSSTASALSVLTGPEEVEFSAAEEADQLSEVAPTSPTALSPTGSGPRRLLTNLPEGSFLRARRMKALAAREDGLAQTGVVECTPHPDHPEPEVLAKSASLPSSSPTRRPSLSAIHRPLEPPRGRGLGPEGGTQRGCTTDPPSSPRLQVEPARTRSESCARRCVGLEIDVSPACLGSGSAEEGSGSNEERGGLSPNCLVWVKSQSPKKAGESKVLKRARVLVVDRAKSQCKIKPRDGPTQVVGLHTVERFRLNTVFNPDANEVREIA